MSSCVPHSGGESGTFGRSSGALTGGLASEALLMSALLPSKFIPRAALAPRTAIVPGRGRGGGTSREPGGRDGDENPADTSGVNAYGVSGKSCCTADGELVSSCDSSNEELVDDPVRGGTEIGAGGLPSRAAAPLLLLRSSGGREPANMMSNRSGESIEEQRADASIDCGRVPSKDARGEEGE